MQVRFWGTRGSLPVAPHASTFTDKIADALVAANGKSFANKQAALDFARDELEFAVGQGYADGVRQVDQVAQSFSKFRRTGFHGGPRKA